MSDSKAKSVRVTLIKSVHGQIARHRATVRGLGLKRIRDSRVVSATPEVSGMLRSAQHLLRVEEV
jgi:large subunit ribosomal protein L30